MFRPDIEVLRAVAVLAVVAYHLHDLLPPLPASVDGAFRGGYVGVDVFFVLSGYLITGGILRDLDAQRGVRVREFYARRVRRILPAATATIVGSLTLSWLFENQLAQAVGRGDARAAALFYSNYRFAWESTDYLGEAADVSMFQQFWSLSLEEQYYLLWPACVALGLVLGRRLRARPDTTLLVLSSAVVVASLSHSVVTSESNPIPAFFSLPTRAWEIAAGALLAIVTARWRWEDRAGPRPSVAASMAAVGYGAIGLSVVAFGPDTTWPGHAAAVPVLGAMAVVTAGLGGAPPGRALWWRLRTWWPLQQVGRHSFSIYLWHWPIIVVLSLQRWPWPRSYGAAILLTTGAAVASYRLVEQPIRNSPRLRSRPNRSLLLGAVLIAGGVAASFAFGAIAPALHAGVPSLGPDHRTGAAPVADEVVPSDLEPALEKGTSRWDPNAERNTDCAGPNRCSYGDPASAMTAVVFGDSNAGQWVPALEVALGADWHIERITSGGCSSFLAVGSRWPDVQGCEGFLEDGWAYIDETHPDLVVLANRNDHTFAHDRDRWEEELDVALRRASAMTKVLVIGQIPTPASDVPHCLSEYVHATAQCEPPWPDPTVQAINAELGVRTAAAGGAFVDPVPIMCAADRCPAIASGILVYRDAHHITTAFAESRAADLRAAMESVLLPPL